MARDLDSNQISFITDHLTRFALFGSSTATLRVSKEVNEASVLGGARLTYTLGLSNPSLADALNVSLTDTLPSGLTTPDTGTRAGQLLRRQGGLSAQQRLGLAYTVTTFSESLGQTLTNTVRVAADNPVSVEDHAVILVRPPSDRNALIFLPLILKGRGDN